MSSPGRSPRVADAVSSIVQRWPASRARPGLLHGWHGAAWVRFQQGARAPRLGAAIERRLASESGSGAWISMFVGSAANALIASYGVRAGIVRASFLRQARGALVTAARASREWDVTFGAAGALLACAEMAVVNEHRAPRALIELLARRVSGAADAMRPGTGGWYTGMAHGLAGAILALECADSVGGVAYGARQAHFDALVAAALRSQDGGVWWPQRAGGAALEMQSWCHGTPGVVLALLALHRLTGEAAYGALAEDGLAGMEWLVAHQPPVHPTLCCGAAGIAQIFIEAYRVLGAPRWLAAARRLEPARVEGARSLFRGDLGRAYLVARLALPRAYAMPGIAFVR